MDNGMIAIMICLMLLIAVCLLIVYDWYTIIRNNRAAYKKIAQIKLE